jgi:hypothetical protein
LQITILRHGGNSISGAGNADFSLHPTNGCIVAIAAGVRELTDAHDPARFHRVLLSKQ